MKKYVVLLSAGLDSTVNLYKARREGQVVLALTFDYGQKARLKEISSAKKICKKLGILHQVLRLPFITEFGGSSLTQRDLKVPTGSNVKIESKERSKRSARAVWVPNRNGIFLNVAAGFAESLGADFIVPGFNLEEAQTFPDNSEAFLQSLNRSFHYSTANHVKVKCFTTGLDKTQIVKMGTRLKVDWSMIWPCYLSQRKCCGACESCLRSLRAFTKARVKFENLMD